MRRSTFEDRVERTLTTCVHFSGVMERTCKAGVDLSSVTPEGCSVPCIAPLGGRKQGECSRRELPTREAAKAKVLQRDAEFEDGERKMRILAPVLNVWRSTSAHGKSEVIACPVCSGRLTLSKSIRNGHVSGRCDTPGCIHFIE